MVIITLTINAHVYIEILDNFLIPLIGVNQAIDLMSRVFVNDPGDWGSIPGRVMPKTQKWYLVGPCLTLGIIRYGSRVKWSNPGEGVVPSLTPRCSNY